MSQGFRHSTAEMSLQVINWSKSQLLTNTGRVQEEARTLGTNRKPVEGTQIIWTNGTLGIRGTPEPGSGRDWSNKKIDLEHAEERVEVCITDSSGEKTAFGTKS